MTLFPQPENFSFYGDKTALLEAAREELLDRIGCLRRECALAGLRDPVDHCKARIKSAESMQKKLERRGLPVTAEAALSHIYDAAGIRVVCTFIDDVYRVRDWLANQPEITVTGEKDYIRSPKPNGYRSYHMLVEIPAGDARLHAEIQIRTLAMDFWASLEHQMKYKQEIPFQELMADELKRCADEIASTDINLQAIRELIMSA